MSLNYDSGSVFANIILLTYKNKRRVICYSFHMILTLKGCNRKYHIVEISCMSLL